MKWYVIYWLNEKSYSRECYSYKDAFAAAKEQNLGRFKIVPMPKNFDGSF